MALTRNKRAMAGIFASGLAVWLSCISASALSPTPPCDGIESGMQVDGAHAFGYEGSGFVFEYYSNAMLPAEQPADGGPVVIEFQPAPIPELEEFLGYRIINCSTMEMLAISGEDDDKNALIATEFLRPEVQARQAFSFSDVQTAAKAIYKGTDVRILRLKETEETCSCRLYAE